MQTNKCPVCIRTPIEPVNLRCHHTPCYACAHSLLGQEHTSTIEIKYKIICPSCNQKTVFFDLRHLIRTHQNQEMYFVTDRHLSSKAQPKIQYNQPTRYEANYVSSEHSQPMSRRGSIHSIANKALAEVKCLEHGEVCRYYCSDCGDSDTKNCLLCNQCTKGYQHSSHKLLSIKQAESKLATRNLRTKDALLSREGELSHAISYLSHNKQVVEDYYKKMVENLSIEFESIYAFLQERYNTLRNSLQEQQEQNLKDLDTRIERWTSQQHILQSLSHIELKDFETHAKFYQTCQKISTTNSLPTKKDLQLIQLPTLTKDPHLVQYIQKLVALQLPQPTQTPPVSRKNSRKPSMDAGDCSHRSIRDKQNLKAGFSPARIPGRKLVC